MNKLLVLIGPSGVGKSSLAVELARRGSVELFPTWTTRPRRSYEMQSTPDHVFADESEFDARWRQGYFLGVAQPFGLPYRYGLPKICRQTHSVPAVILRAFLLGELHQHYPNTVVYQIEADLQRVDQHLASREQAGHAKRLESHQAEMILGRRLALRCVPNNGELSDALDQIQNHLHDDFPPEMSVAESAALR